jgi:GalNAc-alpha-(1->4)-GalNAc-alpha-(1->3)-diNAcBac-PP-undecaprenol alpha-1,4-N-acetyl-D-galactosaminyltransferase
MASHCESGPSEIISHNENGLLVSPGDIPALANAMQSLANSPALRTRLSEVAPRVNDRFSPARIFARWEAVLA